MRDLKIITPSDDSPWNLDIDIINGYPSFLDKESQTQDQRAAVAAYMAKGTVPGMPDVGIDWYLLYEKGKTLITIDNEIKQAIQTFASPPGGGLNGVYMPSYKVTEEGVNLQIYHPQELLNA